MFKWEAVQSNLWCVVHQARGTKRGIALQHNMHLGAGTQGEKAERVGAATRLRYSAVLKKRSKKHGQRYHGLLYRFAGVEPPAWGRCSACPTLRR